VDDHAGLRDSLFLDKLGDGYVAEAFRLAREADPDALLIYNDYGAEGLGGKSDRVYALAKKLVTDRVPIDGVGLQMHVLATDYPNPKDIAANVRRLAALGLKVNISEMDVGIRDAPGSLPDRFQQQRRVYHDVIDACCRETNFMGVTFWGFTDALSYDPSEEGFVFDESYAPKPAYWGILEALLQSP
jgi:endo-1,4-beta-xylanase